MQTQLPASAVRDTLAAVFAQEPYDRGLRETLAGRFWSWLGELLRRLLPDGDAPPLVRWTPLGLLALVVLAVVWRVAYVMWARRIAAGQQAAQQLAQQLAQPAPEAARECLPHATVVGLLGEDRGQRVADRAGRQLRLHGGRQYADQRAPSRAGTIAPGTSDASLSSRASSSMSNPSRRMRRS